MYCFTESLLSRRVLRPNFFTSIYVLFSNKIMFLLSKVVRTNLFIQYCLTFSRNSHKCIYRKGNGALDRVRGRKIKMISMSRTWDKEKI